METDMKDANHGTRLKPKKKPAREAPPPSAPGDEHPVRPGSDLHRANQHELGVGEDHLTEDMRREKRGTFP
jgi:hypothetical protein